MKTKTKVKAGISGVGVTPRAKGLKVKTNVKAGYTGTVTRR